MTFRTELWTDGSGTRSGPVGFAWLLRAVDAETGEVVKELTGEGAERDGTNNRAELLAVLTGLLELKLPYTQVTVFSDSAYVVDNASSRLARWQANGWRSASGGQRREGDDRDFMCALCAAPGHQGEPCERHAPAVPKNAARDDGAIVNRDLWQLLSQAMELHRVSFVLVKGHAGIEANEDCDRRAGEARKALVAELAELAGAAAGSDVGSTP